MASSGTQTVWLIHGDSAVRERVEAALAVIPNLKIERALDPGELEQLQGGLPRLVLAEASRAKRILKELDRLVPSAMRLFLCPMADQSAVNGLMRLAGEGHGFQTLDDALPTYQLSQHLSALLHGRLAGRVVPQSPGALLARFEIDGRTVHGRVLDVSSQGLGLALDIESLIELLAPGNVLERLQLYRPDGTVLLSSPSATVRHVQVLRDSDRAFFRIGVSIPPLASRSIARDADVAREALKDPVRIASLLRRAVHRNSRLQVQLIGAHKPHVPAKALDLVSIGPRRTGVSLLVDEGLEIYEGDILELHFDFGGQGYWGAGAVVARTDEGQYTVSLPQTLQQQHRRISPRFTPIRSCSVVVSFTSPLTGEQLVRPVLDIHSGGMSFFIDEEREPFPPGLLIPEMTLRFSDGRAFKASATARGCRPLNEVKNLSLAGVLRPGRCGVSFTSSSPELTQAVLSAYVATRYAEVTDAVDVPFESVWQFMADVGRFSPDYPLTPGPHVQQLATVQTAIERSAEILGKAYTQREQGKLVGYVAGLRMYSRTWLVQHLAVHRGFHRRDTISQKLTSLAVEYGEALSDIDFIRYDWFTTNRWPHRMSMWVASNLSSPGLTKIRFVNDVRLHGALAPPTRALPAVRRATAPDLAWLENYLKLQGDCVAMRSDDLSVRELTMQTLSDKYAKAGLERGRAIFVVDGPHSPVGFALAESGTPGLCWAEFTNAFKIVLTEPTLVDPNSVREALVRQAIYHYRSNGRESVIALCSDSETEQFASLGFAHVGRLGEFTFHKSLARRWQALATAMFERLGNQDLPTTPSVEEEAA